LPIKKNYSYIGIKETTKIQIATAEITVGL